MYNELYNYLQDNLEIIERSNYSVVSMKKNHLDFYNKLINIPLFRENNFHWKKMIYYVIYDLHEIQKCKICKDKEAIFHDLKQGYSTVCSILCSRRDPEWKVKAHSNVDYKKRTKNMKKTILEKYGVENVSQIELIKEKKKETCLKNYGVDHPLKNKEISNLVAQKNRSKFPQTLEKIKRTTRKKYGKDFYGETEEHKNHMILLSKDEDYIEKKRKSHKEYFKNNPEQKELLSKRIKKYWASLSKEEKEKFAKKTSLILKELYADDEKRKEIVQRRNKSLVDNCSDEILNELNISRDDKDAHNKISYYYTQKGTLKKYGVDNVFKLEYIQQKCRDVIKEKYNVDNISQHKLFRTMARERSDKNINEIFSKRFNILDINRDDDYKKNILNLKCLTCNYEFYLKFHGIIYKNVKCPNCSLTSIEEGIKKLLNEKDIPYNVKDRSMIPPNELDFFIKDYNLAIECNGLYWHCDLFVDKDYHYKKYKKCKDENIKLLQFFEDDILDKQEIVKSIIYHNLNIHDKVVHGRKCIIRNIESKEKGIFLKENHLMGNDKSKVSLGAFYNDELVSVMTFNHGNITIKENEIFDWELSRFCSKNFYKIHGIANKLFQYFLKSNPEDIKIKTYASIMTGDGSVYKNLGFNLSKRTAPGYFYTSNGIRFHRFKSLSLRENLSISERDDMLSQGYYKVFDAGNNKYIFTTN